MGNAAGSLLSSKRKAMIAAWDAHCAAEFDNRSVDETMATMTGDSTNFVLNVPVCRGGKGPDGIAAFYGHEFIPANPDDTKTTLVARTVDAEGMKIVDELVFEFTHDREMPWILPGVAPTGIHVTIPLVVSIGFDASGKKVISERIYWDQAGVLQQIGKLPLEKVGKLPIVGKRQGDTVLRPLEKLGSSC
jgi:carboxymethylenebutenolidase